MLIGKRFELRRLIGIGSISTVYLAFDEREKQFVALKMSKSDFGDKSIEREYLFLEILYDMLGVPSFIHFGVHEKNTYVVSQLLGPNLSELLEFCSGRFTIKTVLMLADLLIDRLSCIHSKGIVHRDIKPENVLMGVGLNKTRPYFIDFGLSKLYIDSESKHVPFGETREFAGSALFMSKSTFDGYAHTRRDDMVSLGYMMIFFLKGGLPWKGLLELKTNDYYRRVSEMKQYDRIDELCTDLPEEFGQYLKRCVNLNPEESPPYTTFSQMFRTLGQVLKINYDYNFDWLLVKKAINGKDVNKEASDDEGEENNTSE